jgi:hypothetical protein
MKPLFALIFATSFFPANAAAFEPAPWMQRCFAAAEVSGTADPTTEDGFCIYRPLDACQFDLTPKQCHRAYRQAIVELTEGLSAALPIQVEGPGFSPKTINRMLKRISENSYDTCSETTREKLEREAKIYPEWLSIEELCFDLKAGFRFAEIRAVIRMIAKLEAAK